MNRFFEKKQENKEVRKTNIKRLLFMETKIIILLKFMLYFLCLMRPKDEEYCLKKDCI